MKLIRNLFYLLIICTNLLLASTSSDIKILDASENIKLLSQKIAKDYIYFYNFQYKKELPLGIKKNIILFEKNIRTISVLTKDEKIKRILGFFDYEKENLLTLLNNKPTKDYASEVLDFSESVTEGTSYLRTYTKYNYSFEEKMLLLTKDIRFRSEEILKYYSTLCTDMNNLSINEKIESSLLKLKEDIDHIEQYNYPKEIAINKQDLNIYFNLYKKLYKNVNTSKLPSIALIAANGFTKTMISIANYHRKNQ